MGPAAPHEDSWGGESPLPPMPMFLFVVPGSLLIWGNSGIPSSGSRLWALFPSLGGGEHVSRKSRLEPEVDSSEGRESLSNYKAGPRKWGDYTLAELANAVHQAI